MPTGISRDDDRTLREDGAQLVEALPNAEYNDEHLPGAVSIPLKELDPEIAARLNTDSSIIVYCHDYQWDMSPRAAWRLESLGLTRV